MMDRLRLGYVTAMAVGAGSAMFLVWWWWWSCKQKDRPPKKWRKVGELSDLMLFPVKSLGVVRENSMECTNLGVKAGWLRDRTLMVVDLKGHYVTARQIPKMVQVSPSVAGSVLTFRAPGMMSASIDLSQIRGKNFQVTVWGQEVVAQDCGEEIARWLSRLLLQEDVGLRLVYYPLKQATRDVRKRDQAFPLIMPEDTGAYPDTTSYMLINEASIIDLNTRIEDSVTPQQFRPNFVAKGAQPLEEDHWDWVKIGQVIFRNVKPCTRCVFTTIDPETGKKHPKAKPLETLRKYRLLDDPVLSRATNYSPVMGIHLSLKGPQGVVRLGDTIYVGVSETEDAPLLSPP